MSVPGQDAGSSDDGVTAGRRGERAVDLEGSGPAVRDDLGAGFESVAAFGRLLAEHGEVRGLLGPRELPRLWERHLLNSATMREVLPPSGSVADVGSGAGLPGIVLACLRPDLSFTLVESMQRRVAWLEEVVDALSLPNVTVTRARAEDLHGAAAFDAVTARAVAPLGRLAVWCLPLLRVGGELLALKGERAAVELAEARPELAALGGDAGEVIDVAAVGGAVSSTVIRVRRVVVVPRARSTRRRR